MNLDIKKMDKRLKLYIPFSVIVFIVIVFSIGKLIQWKDYNNAVNLMNRGKYEKAAEAFETMGKYKNCVQLKLKCELMPYYKSAITLMEDGKYIPAKKKFDVLGNFLDSKKKSIYCINSYDYQYALKLMHEEDYISAMYAFKKLENFKKAKMLATECKHRRAYDEAKELLISKKYKNAREAFEKLGNYKDSENMVKKCLQEAYQTATELMEKKKYTSAKIIYAELGVYKDSTERCIKCENLELKAKYQKAISLFKNKKYYTACLMFQDMRGYKDSKDKAKACIRKYPKTQLLYKNKKFSFNFAPVIIHAGTNEPTYLKIYTKKGKLAATAFINSGDTIHFKMPSGNYIIKEADGSKWYGESEMFGEEGKYYVLNTELKFKNWGAGYKITLNNSAGGNLESKNAGRKGF